MHKKMILYFFQNDARVIIVQRNIGEETLLEGINRQLFFLYAIFKKANGIKCMHLMCLWLIKKDYLITKLENELRFQFQLLNGGHTNVFLG